MEDLFERAFESVMDGARFSVDFKNRTLKVNGEVVVNVDSHITGDLDSPVDFLSNLDDKYRVYKHSVPSERSVSKRKSYFIPLNASDLSDEDMMYGVGREVAQAELEFYVLHQILLGLKWKESWGKWFYQSVYDKDLILLRDWIEP